ncbi:phosphoglucosamine mutase [Dongia mobilis]|uniref:Phosphoglucosamine mutase n=1 Tax=Dongia mobilis TaxID=578943 RepID=A0A4R6WD68_9PROT|nr:phosphoglucosamine mutase [Dongia mobilis]TDQ77623.1 phosphoglucosamine mutase [Dongia mobilis]
MTRKFFGTDGVRGLANAEPITAMTALKLALAAGAHFRRGRHRHRVIIGKDTRLSGYMLETALTSGFLSMGMDVMLLGPLPTPAVAMLTRSMRADIGVMISASHNPYEDNGIKLFGPDGYKLSDEIEAEIEARMAADEVQNLAPSAQLGRAKRIDDAPGRYMEFVKASFPKGLSLEGLKVVIDCAHGAAYKVAPTVLWELGAEVVAIANEPNGTNINAGCGAVHTEKLCQTVIREKADLGIALDGDADRVIVADETGAVIDGDQLMALIAADWRATERLAGGGIAATVMSNLGLERYLQGLGIALYRTPVGDRYVVEAMRRFGLNLGGEQSGHIVLSDFATTGDGLIAALQVLAVLRKSGRAASEAGRAFAPLPQMLKNVRFGAGTQPPLDQQSVKAAIAAGEAALDGCGRLLIRKSGTEPLIRVMAEGEDEALVARVVDDIVAAVEAVAR